ncbi:MAG: carotenoid 1,2-hydratase [Beijerinckiaceae bacterium]
MRSSGPDFSLCVPHNGYAWWYIDALSDDGAHGLTIIAFVGSVFSPYYKWARRRAAANPEHHCALNVALYGSPRRWTMTERGASKITRAEDVFTIGPSALTWRDDRLIIDIRERGAPLPLALRGRVSLRPDMLFDRTFHLDEGGQHRWRPIAPLARVEVEMESPRLSWRGKGYFDHNHGAEPLESGFSSWDWSRAHSARDTVVFYDAKPSQDMRRELALRFRSDGAIEDIKPPGQAALPSTRIWRIARRARNSPGTPARVLKTLEDTPFYSRSIIETALDGEILAGFHESLDLGRFSMPVVQAMLPFRMPRRSH